jgi:hypothetical protein
VDESAREFYGALRRILQDRAYHDGAWSSLDAQPAGPDDPPPPIIAGRWRLGSAVRIVVANLSGATAYARVRIPLRESGPSPLRFRDELNGKDFERDRSEVLEPGLFVELAPWSAHFLTLEDPAP